jgi:hypothetical protein
MEKNRKTNESRIYKKILEQNDIKEIEHIDEISWEKKRKEKK